MRFHRIGLEDDKRIYMIQAGLSRKEKKKERKRSSILPKIGMFQGGISMIIIYYSLKAIS